MKIAVVCPYDLGAPGGVQQLTSELVERLRERGEDAWLVGPGRSRTGSPSVGSTVTVPGNRSRVPVALGPGVLAAVRAQVAAADVVHVHEPMIPLVSPAALRSGRPLVATFHAGPPRWARALYRMAEAPGRFLMRGVREVTAVSPVAAEAVPPTWGPVGIVPNAIDTASYPVPVERVPGRVAFLGRDDRRKGLDVLLRAWPAIRSQVPEAELWAMGVTRSEAPAGVRYLGVVSEDEKRAGLASSAVFVAPHLGGESFGMVVVEAMAAGCAVVASDLPAFRWVLGSAGRPAPVGDPAALASAVVALLRDPSARESLGAAAAERARLFDWSPVVDAYLERYRRAAVR